MPRGRGRPKKPYSSLVSSYRNRICRVFEKGYPKIDENITNRETIEADYQPRDLQWMVNPIDLPEFSKDEETEEVTIFIPPSQAEASVNENATTAEPEVTAGAHSTAENENIVDDDVLSTIVDELREWALSVPHKDVKTVLGILKKHHDFKDRLPLDPRTFLGTCRNVPYTEISPGTYTHFGLQGSLVSYLSASDQKHETLRLLFGIDGVPVGTDGQSQLWPIMCGIVNSATTKNMHIFTVGVYEGKQKPKSASDYLRQFVNELKVLKLSGLCLNEQVVEIKIVAIAADAPARAFILGIKSHSGYNACSRCKVEGDYMGCVTFREIDCPHRTHAEALVRDPDADHYVNSTCLTEVPDLDLVQDFPLDYMHSVCLGVTRTLIKTWLKGSLDVRLPGSVVREISAILNKIKCYVPSDFARKPRDLEKIAFWKATELRQFLLYTGPIVLEKHLPRELYQHFMLLSAAIRIAVNPEVCQREVPLIRSLLKEFVNRFMRLYPKNRVTFNIHSLTHIADDVQRHGPLDLISCFHFENYLFKMTSSLRNAIRPRAQLAKRNSELQASLLNSLGSKMEKKPYVCLQHQTGPVVEKTDDTRLYGKCVLPDFTIKAKSPDNMVSLLDGSVVSVMNFSTRLVKGKQKIFVIGRKFTRVRQFKNFNVPYSATGALIVSNPSFLEEWPLSHLKKKCMLLPYRDSQVAMPLLHS